jgi:hypothetical protein
MAKDQATSVKSSPKKRGRPAKRAQSAPTSPVASQKRARRETLRSITAKNPPKKIDMRSILDKHPGARILGPKTPAPDPDVGPSNAPEELPDEQLGRVSHSSSALILDLT